MRLPLRHCSGTAGTRISTTGYCHSQQDAGRSDRRFPWQGRCRDWCQRCQRSRCRFPAAQISADPCRHRPSSWQAQRPAHYRSRSGGTRRGRLGQGELIDRIGLDIIAPVQAHLDVVGARHKAAVRHHIECLISRKLQVIQGCIVHLQHHCRDRGAALALCGIVRLHHIPRQS